jgi:hypothetical protein
MCELRHGMGATWARHAMCESALKVFMEAPKLTSWKLAARIEVIIIIIIIGH